VATGAKDITGIGVSPGRAVGPVVRMPDPVAEPPGGETLTAPERKLGARRIDEAAAAVKETLEALAMQAVGDAKAVLEATALMAADPTLLTAAHGKVTTAGVPPERAVWEAAAEVAATLRSLGGRMAERVRDLEDVRNRLVAQLIGRPGPGVPKRPQPFVLVARDLAPADTATLDPAAVRALVTAEGGPASHTAIIARELGLPAVVAAPDVLELPEGTVVLVDGGSGVVQPNPSAEDMSKAATPPRRVRRFRGPAATRDGRPIPLLANVGDPPGALAAAEAGAEGVGLFRTEFCFLDRAEAPSIAEQASQYRRVFAAFPGKRVVVRTLDAGADKPLPFLGNVSEANPALGVRGLRTYRRAPQVLRDQLQAIATAAAEESAEVWVMAPMVATATETREFVELCGEHGLATAGVMIEVPSAAMCADEILRHAKFASIGTNDLTQYAMAADRLIGELAPLATPWQPAVLRLIELTTQAGVRNNRPVGVCGEAAADPALAVVLVGLGVSSLSMTPRAFVDVAEALAARTYDDCVEAAHRATAAKTAEDARLAVRAWLGKSGP
jgi:phosphoenolpyruvate-protein phosphotransferase (PTS system enzyme I)